jgi:hypothetical protein
MQTPPLIQGTSVRTYPFFIAATVLGLAVAVLFFFNPAQYGFYPRCFLKLTTGLECAGCGGLRATHQLLNGNFAAAFQLNPLLFFAIAIAAIFMINIVSAKFTGTKILKGRMSAMLLWSLLVAAIAFSVLRNI